MRRADNLNTFLCRLPRNSGASTSRNPKGLYRPVAGKLYLYSYWSIQMKKTAETNTTHVNIFCPHIRHQFPTKENLTTIKYMTLNKFDNLHHNFNSMFKLQIISTKQFLVDGEEKCHYVHGYRYPFLAQFHPSDFFSHFKPESNL